MGLLWMNESIKNTSLEVTHIALNDGTIEGLKHKDYACIHGAISS